MASTRLMVELGCDAQGWHRVQGSAQAGPPRGRPGRAGGGEDVVRAQEEHRRDRVLRGRPHAPRRAQPVVGRAVRVLAQRGGTGSGCGVLQACPGPRAAALTGLQTHTRSLPWPCACTRSAADRAACCLRALAACGSISRKWQTAGMAWLVLHGKCVTAPCWAPSAALMRRPALVHDTQRERRTATLRTQVRLAVVDGTRASHSINAPSRAPAGAKHPPWGSRLRTPHRSSLHTPRHLSSARHIRRLRSAAGCQRADQSKPGLRQSATQIRPRTCAHLAHMQSSLARDHSIKAQTSSARSAYCQAGRAGRKHVVAGRHDAHGLDAAAVAGEGADAVRAQRVPQRQALVAGRRQHARVALRARRPPARSAAAAAHSALTGR